MKKPGFHRIVFLGMIGQILAFLLKEKNMNWGKLLDFMDMNRSILSLFIGVFVVD